MTKEHAAKRLSVILQKIREIGRRDLTDAQSYALLSGVEARAQTLLEALEKQAAC